MSKSKKKVKNLHKPRLNVTDNISKLDDIIYIDFTKYDKWLDSVELDDFTNYFHDEKEALKKLYFVLHQLIPDIEKKGKEIFKEKHCHSVKGKQATKAIKIVKKFHGKNVLDDETEIWELSAQKGGVRIFGVFINDTFRRFYPLFMDYHHLLYSDKNYNEADYKNNKFGTEHIN